MANSATPVVKILETSHTVPHAYRTGHGVDELCSEHGKAVSEEVYWAEYYSHPSFSYQPFMMPEYQAARARAEQESQRAQQAEAAFLAEQQRSAQMAARLRSLGVSVDD